MDNYVNKISRLSNTFLEIDHEIISTAILSPSDDSSASLSPIDSKVGVYDQIMPHSHTADQTYGTMRNSILFQATSYNTLP